MYIVYGYTQWRYAHCSSYNSEKKNIDKQSGFDTFIRVWYARDMGAIAMYLYVRVHKLCCVNKNYINVNVCAYAFQMRGKYFGAKLWYSIFVLNIKRYTNSRSNLYMHCIYYSRMYICVCTHTYALCVSHRTLIE